MNVPSPAHAKVTPSAALGSKPKSTSKAVSKADSQQKQGSDAGNTKAVAATSSIPFLLSIPTQAPSTLAHAATKSNGAVASEKAQPTISLPPATSSMSDPQA